MGLFFWDYQDYNDIQREWTMFIVNFLAFLFTSYSLYRTAKYHGRVMFELLPLSINTLATLLLLFIKLFEKGYEFDLVGYTIQIFTYFLFCYTFALLHTKLIAHHRIHLEKTCNIIFTLLALASFVLIMLIVTSVIAKDCDNDMMELSIAGFATEFISYAFTLYFGIDILKSITQKHEQQKTQSLQQNPTQNIFTSTSDQYVKQRKKQIQLVILAYTISLFLRALILGFNFNWDNYFICSEYDGVHIVTSDMFIGQCMLVLIQINQLIPHLVIPVALYIIPVKKNRKSTDVHLLQTLIDEDQDIDHSDFIQRRISSSILTRSISPSKYNDEDNSP